MSAKKQKHPAEFLKLLKGVKAKRPRTVIDHILKHGHISTEELKETYGYNHPPRAVRDVREHGIPIDTFRVEGSDGRKIAAYRFGDPSKTRAAQLSGRTAFSRDLKSSLIRKFGPRCNIYLEPFPAKDLQIDHRIPFEIAGEGDLSNDVDDYMLLCASANRAKSWSCENCENWTQKKIEVCRACYWASPEEYTHVAMLAVRRLDILWSGADVTEYDSLREESAVVQKAMPDFVKSILRNHLKKGEA